MNKLVAIVGPTASGKTDLAIRVAEKFNGEIICADSRTIYRGMDIGTAKPSKQDRARIKHHLLDILNPDQTYSAGQFQIDANRLIKDIQGRSKLPILVGGTGLYIYGVVYNYKFPADSPRVRQEWLAGASPAEMVKKLEELDPEMAEQIDLKNPRRVSRALLISGEPKAKSKLNGGTLLVALKPKSETLNTRIAQRTKSMIEQRLVSEVRQLIEQYGPNIEAFNTVGYREVIDHLDGRISSSELENLINLHTRQLVKRQLTWYKRNPDIIWFEHPVEALQAIERFMAFAHV